MYEYSAVLGKHVPRKQAENIGYFHKLVEGKRLGPFIATLFYSLSPLPSNFLFIASGISGAKRVPIIAGFAVGRFISYAFLVHASSVAYTFVQGFGIQNLRYIVDIFGLLAAISIIFIDWRKIFQHSARFRVSIIR